MTADEANGVERVRGVARLRAPTAEVGGSIDAAGRVDGDEKRRRRCVAGEAVDGGAANRASSRGPGVAVNRRNIGAGPASRDELAAAVGEREVVGSAKRAVAPRDAVGRGQDGAGIANGDKQAGGVNDAAERGVSDHREGGRERRQGGAVGAGQDAALSADGDEAAVAVGRVGIVDRRDTAPERPRVGRDRAGGGGRDTAREPDGDKLTAPEGERVNVGIADGKNASGGPGRAVGGRDEGVAIDADIEAATVGDGFEVSKRVGGRRGPRAGAGGGCANRARDADRHEKVVRIRDRIEGVDGAGGGGGPGAGGDGGGGIDRAAAGDGDVVARGLEGDGVQRDAGGAEVTGGPGRGVGGRGIDHGAGGAHRDKTRAIVHHAVELIGCAGSNRIPGHAVVGRDQNDPVAPDGDELAGRIRDGT